MVDPVIEDDIQASNNNVNEDLILSQTFNDMKRHSYQSYLWTKVNPNCLKECVLKFAKYFHEQKSASLFQGHVAQVIMNVFKNGNHVNYSYTLAGGQKMPNEVKFQEAKEMLYKMTSL